MFTLVLLKELREIKEIVMERIIRNKNVEEMKNYRGYKIVESNKIEGWWMTECGTVVGESIEEVLGDIDWTIRKANLGEKVTLYYKGEFGMGVTKIEGRLQDYGTKKWAQYNSAAYVDIIPKKCRNARRYMQTYDPYMVLVKGWGHQDTPEAMEVVADNAELTVKRSRYTAFDPRWVQECDEILNEKIENGTVEVLADYRKSAGFNTYDKYALDHAA